MLRARALAVALGSMVLPASLRAQCPDGTPAPCGAARRAARPPVEPPPESARAGMVMVLPFRNLARSQAQDWLVEASTAMLANGLRHASQLTIAPDERVFPALRRQGLSPGQIMDAARVRRVAEETGGWTAIYGEVLALSNTVVLSARAADVVTGRQLGFVAVQLGEGDDIRSGFDSLAIRLIGALGLRATARP